ncbi:MAG: GGDEF domain-containing protein [Chitinivibrionales bacterium]
MKNSSIKWGLPLIAVSLLFSCAALSLWFSFRFEEYEFLVSKVFPVTGMLLSFLLAVTAHFSYHRVQSFRIYLVGYLTGLCGFLYFSMFNNMVLPEFSYTGLYLFALLGVILSQSMASGYKYRAVKQLTAVFFIMFLVLILMSALQPNAFRWIAWIGRSGNNPFRPFIAGVLLGGTSLFLSLQRVGRGFHLMGFFIGLTLMYMLIWFSPFWIDNYKGFDSLQYLFLLLYAEIGVAVYWFSRIEHKVAFDPLLEIYNRNYCSRIIEEQSKVKTEPPLGVAMIDIDHFKEVNDTHGHKAGDDVLKEVAGIIYQDCMGMGVVCRYGGEEIVVFFPGMKAKDVKTIVEDIRADIEKTSVKTGRKRLCVTVSCGISCREDVSQGIADVIEYADKAMYNVKKGGRNSVKVSKTPVASSKRSRSGSKKK